MLLPTCVICIILPISYPSIMQTTKKKNRGFFYMFLRIYGFFVRLSGVFVRLCGVFVRLCVSLWYLRCLCGI